MALDIKFHRLQSCKESMIELYKQNGFKRGMESENNANNIIKFSYRV